MDNSELDIDNTWVDSYKTAEEDYNVFYNEKVSTIKVVNLYIDTENNVVNVTNDVLKLSSESMIPREQLLAMIKSNKIANSSSKYKLFSLVRYNINILPAEVEDFITNSNPEVYNQRFLTVENYIRDIYYSDTISIFQDINALYMIFKEIPQNIQNNNAYKFTQKLKASIKKRYTRRT